MLPKEQRLNTKDVALVFAVKRKTLNTRYFNVVTACLDGLTQKKYAVVVSKKIAPSAVVRNKLRRRVYRGVATLSISNTPPIAIIIQCTKDAVSLGAVEFQAELIAVLNKVI
jgi:ribonuclease P protein component